jgi:hypothetical protein
MALMHLPKHCEYIWDYSTSLIFRDVSTQVEYDCALKQVSVGGLYRVDIDYSFVLSVDRTECA